MLYQDHKEWFYEETLSVLLSVLLLSLVTVPSFAAPATLNKENPVGSVKIFTGEGKQDEYELTIPADTEIPWKLLLTQ